MKITSIALVTSFFFLSSCSFLDMRPHYLAVEDKELGHWQNQIDEICNDLENVETNDDLNAVKEKAEKLRKRLKKNFLDPDDVDKGFIY